MNYIRLAKKSTRSLKPNNKVASKSLQNYRLLCEMVRVGGTLHYQNLEEFVMSRNRWHDCHIFFPTATKNILFLRFACSVLSEFKMALNEQIQRKSFHMPERRDWDGLLKEQWFRESEDIIPTATIILKNYQIMGYRAASNSVMNISRSV